jgi:two-component system, LytTR family, sensor kinase
MMGRLSASWEFPGRLRDNVSRWGIVLILWTLLGLFFASETFFAFGLSGQPITWRHALFYELPGWYVWAALAPLIVLLANRVRFEPSGRTFALVFHTTASALFSILQLTLKIALLRALQPGDEATSFSAALQFVLETRSHFNLLAYWAVLGASYGLEYYRHSQQRDLRASQLETRLAQARLQVLEMELQPHFLFNTLNTVSALVHKDPDTAERMIARLGDLLRLTLNKSGHQEVTLREELELLDRYLEIEQTRFRDRLRVRMMIEPSALSVRVPRLLLQPIVENAIRHGIAPRAAAGSIEVEARCQGGSLQLRVRDDGPGLGNAHPPSGVGLRNTRERLEQLYPHRHRFELQNQQQGGLAVTLTLPLHG